MPQTNCRIDSELLAQIREYSEKTGVPISRCIDEATSQWLQCVAPVRLEALGLEPLTPAF